jgi:O-glycosyl hydrolase
MRRLPEIHPPALLERARAIGTHVSLMLLLCLASTSAICAPVKVVLDGKSTGRIFDGIGAVSAGASSRLLIDYPEPQRSEILDYLFKPGYGASFQHLKVEIGADVNSTDGSEPSHMRSAADHSATRGYEWWLMQEAHKRNPHIVLETLFWGTPAWVGKQVAGKTTPYSASTAGYVVDFIETAKHAYGLDIAYTGMWNERDFDIQFIKDLHARLMGAHLNTKIACCDADWVIADAMLKDPELAAAIDVIGAHYPRDEKTGKVTTTAAARQTGKPLWSSEDQPNGGGGPFVSRDWPVGGRILAKFYNRNYLQGALTSTEIWSPVTSYYDNLAAPNSGLMYANTPWSGHYDVQSTIWVTAHTTQFAQPGWQYLDTGSGNLPGKGSYVALRSADKRNWSVVLETIDAKQPQAISFKLAGGLAATRVHVWETNSTHTFEHVSSVTPVNGKFTYTFDPDSLYSLTTTTGQGKGTAKPPADFPFPFPYADNFEQTAPDHAPKYLSDQDGAFEVQPCVGRPGRCLEQVISTKPLPWAAVPDPFTLAGDDKWTDYTIAADVRFLSAAPAVLMGRIDTADVFKDEKVILPSAYVFRLLPSGAWELTSTEFYKPNAILASGTAAIDASQWHHMSLQFHDARIEATLDGKVLATVDNPAHTHGMIGLATSWDHVQFDNLSVTPYAVSRSQVSQ